MEGGSLRKSGRKRAPKGGKDRVAPPEGGLRKPRTEGDVTEHKIWKSQQPIKIFLLVREGITKACLTETANPEKGRQNQKENKGGGNPGGIITEGAGEKEPETRTPSQRTEERQKLGQMQREAVEGVKIQGG